MKGDLTDAGHHMPFIASWPNKIQAGSTCGALICFTDILATLASLLGEKLPTDAGEAANLFAQEPEKAKELFAALKADIARGRSRP